MAFCASKRHELTGALVDSDAYDSLCLLPTVILLLVQISSVVFTNPGAHINLVYL